ncbi:MAG: helix-turn-helix domain-containing protein [archaeon]
MDKDIFYEIGLTKSETKVYLALLELGFSTTGNIIKKSEVSSGKMYLVLDKLIQKGLATYIIKSGKKYYKASDPAKLIEYLNKKEENISNQKKKLQGIILELRSKIKEESKNYAEIYEGLSGIRTLYSFLVKKVKKEDEYLLLGAPKVANEKLEGYLLKLIDDFTKKGVKIKILYNYNVRQYGKKREKIKFVEVRYMKEEYETPSWIDIVEDYVVTTNITGTPIAFLMKNKDAAESYRKYFFMLWNKAEK